MKNRPQVAVEQWFNATCPRNSTLRQVRRIMAQQISTVQKVQLVSRLRRLGLSMVGAQQAIQGNMVTDPADRRVIARILTTFASQPHDAAAIYDFPGEYAQRFDGIDKGGGG
jgi:hypothetical protein